MDKLIKFYNQNRYIVWLITLVIIAIITLIQILDNFAYKKINTKSDASQNTSTVSAIDKNYSVISETKVNDETSEVIDNFINYCNSQQIEKAYELLSDECKEILYPTIEDFTQKYYMELFNDKKTYLYQAWITSNNKYTYKVDFIDDMLATGTASKASISDYYTVIKNNDKYELNINKFIGIKNIDKKETKNNISINIKRKRIYMDYETYEIEIKNNSNEKMMLDGLQNTNTVYLEDNNEQKYYWQNHEILEEDISIGKLQKKQIEIKFNKEYRPKSETIKINFFNIILGDIILEMEILL